MNFEVCVQVGDKVYCYDRDLHKVVPAKLIIDTDPTAFVPEEAETEVLAKLVRLREQHQ